MRAPLLRWYRDRKRSLPWRELWRRHRDPYHIWVSEIMLQQTVIKAVLPVYERFLTAFPTVSALAAADEDKVRQAVRGLGYYRRFRFLHRAAQELATRGGAWPETFEAWRDLPGIGDYTAAAIASIAFNQPHAVVDGNVERVFARLLDVRLPPTEPGLKSRYKALASELLDQASPGDFNQALMELGQTVCTVTAPACEACPLGKGCLAKARGSQAKAPAPKPARAMTEVSMRLMIPERRGRVGLVIRPPKARFLRGTLGFLTVISSDGEDSLDGFGVYGVAPAAKPMGSVRHSITHHKILARVERVGAEAIPQGLDVSWTKPDDVESRLLSNLDRKAWTKVRGEGA